MSIRRKFALIMLIVFTLNIGTLIGFYNFVLSDKIDNLIKQLQDDVEVKLDQMIDQIDKPSEFQLLLSDSLNDKVTYVIRVQDESGELIYTNSQDFFPTLGVQANRMIQINSSLYLVSLTGAIPFNDATMILPVQLVLKFEYLLIIIITLILCIVIYSFIVKPIEALEVDIKNYQKGIYPKKIKRNDEIGRLHNRFFTLVEDLEQQKAKQNRMIASISHDIKTPLTSIMGYAERLRNGELSRERQSRYVETIYDKSIVIKELVDEFDDYLNDHLMTTLNRQRILVSEVINLLKSEYLEELQELEIEFIMTLVGKDCSLYLDISKVRRVFGNIIDNSVKQLKFQETKKIIIDTVVTDKTVVFRVADNGAGVEEDFLEKIFEPFYTSDPSRKVSGLGLSICRNIIEAHDGQIWAQKNEGQGLIILIQFIRE